jgi:hypothetical protein
VNRNEPSKVICVRMVRETDPYAVPVTSLGRHNHLAAGYANKSLRTLLKGPERGISQAERADSFRDARRSSFRCRTNSAMEPYRGSVESSATSATTCPTGPSSSARAAASARPVVRLSPAYPRTCPLLDSRAPHTPAGRPVLCRLPGWFPKMGNAVRPRATDGMTPHGTASPMLRRIRASLRRLHRARLALAIKDHLDRAPVPSLPVYPLAEGSASPMTVLDRFVATAATSSSPAAAGWSLGSLDVASSSSS